MAAVWIADGAATSVLGLLVGDTRADPVPAGWQPTGRTAVLELICGEDARPLADYLAALRRGLDVAGLGWAAEIFVLSDTRDPARAAEEEAALATLTQGGAINYRRRTEDPGRRRWPNSTRATAAGARATSGTSA